MDIVYVTFNSEKWISNCFHNLRTSEFSLSQLNIYVVDNNSIDNTIYELEIIKKSFGDEFAHFEIIKSAKNLGFGKANNLGFHAGKSDIVCFFNIDTEIYPNTLSLLDEDIAGSEEMVALWELRQFPYEHPKVYDIMTGYTTWSSGAAFAVRREIFNKVNGFDSHIFMYAEDVDLSWKIRAAGYYLKYVPRAIIQHFSYKNSDEIKPNQYIHSIINNLLLRYRYANMKEIIYGNILVVKTIIKNKPYSGARKSLFYHYSKHFFQIPHFCGWKYKKENKNFLPKFLGFDYEIIRDGAFYENKFCIEDVLVSVIVRTCGRPDVLRETLMSIRNQTYRSIEIIVVEDGEDTASNMINKEFNDIKIKYYATGAKVGRSRAGNIAMEMATGKYLNFLDDDDMFYADHVEILVNQLMNSDNKAAYARAFEVATITYSKKPYRYEEKCHSVIHRQKFSRPTLYYHNYIPIQCIMFEKELFNNYGGLDETLDALEDWDLWVRYSLHTDFDTVEKVTSIYRVPYESSINADRQRELDNALIVVREKHKHYIINLSVYELYQTMQELIKY